MLGRMVWRVFEKRKGACFQAWRSGWSLFFEYGQDHLTRWQVPKPGSWSKTNVFKGHMPGTPAEYRKVPLTGKRCARILELAWERGITLPNLKVMRKTMSLLYLLETGVEKSNYSKVNAMFKSLNLKKCGAKKSNLPTKIVSSAQLKTAYTKEWTPESGMSLVDFCQGDVANWDWNVLGNRPKEDLGKIKESRTHVFDGQGKWWASQYPGGRSKLGDNKDREWWAWRLCLCPGGVHVPPPESLEIDAEGNPKGPLPEDVCTTCPVFCGQLLKSLQSEGDFGVYKTWNQKSGFGVQNNYDIVNLARVWLAEQGVMDWATPFDSHGGRKSLGAWCQHLEVQYFESIHIHGDLYDTWRKHYQPLLPPTTYTDREQSKNPEIALAALRKLRRYFGRNPPRAPPPPGLTKDSQVLLMMAGKYGLYNEARDIYMS